MNSMKKWMRAFLVVAASVTIVLFLPGNGSIVEAKSQQVSMGAGAALILDADISMGDDELTAYVRSVNGSSEIIVKEEKEYDSDFVMANVKESLNVRQDPYGSAAKIGMLYADCGGTIISREDGWTLLRSGNLVGWCNDKYLLFGEEAEALAQEVGVVMAKVTADGLRVRGDKSTDAKLLGYLNNGNVVEVIEEYTNEDEWITISFEGDTGYILKEYAEIELIVDKGETKEEIAAREEEEKKERRKHYKDIDSYTSHMTDLELLAALIYCEAGNQSAEGKLAVGAVVMNRVKCPSYPDTIRGVIGASGQFSPVASGFLKKVITEKKVPQSCYEAAQKAMNGETPVGSAMHFRRAGKREGIVIGDHVFW